MPRYVGGMRGVTRGRRVDFRFVGLVDGLRLVADCIYFGFILFDSLPPPGWK